MRGEVDKLVWLVCADGGELKVATKCADDAAKAVAREGRGAFVVHRTPRGMVAIDRKVWFEDFESHTADESPYHAADVMRARADMSREEFAEVRWPCEYHAHGECEAERCAYCERDDVCGKEIESGEGLGSNGPICSSCRAD